MKLVAIRFEGPSQASMKEIADDFKLNVTMTGESEIHSPFDAQDVATVTDIH